jgi:hypothetical protein
MASELPALTVTAMTATESAQMDELQQQMLWHGGLLKSASAEV